MSPVDGDRAGQHPPERDDAPESAARELPAALRPFEAALGSLAPRGDCLDYDLVMFRAGQLSVSDGGQHRRDVNGGRRRRGKLGWPLAFAGMTGLAVGLLGLLLARPVVEQVRVVRVPAVTTSDKVATQPDGSTPSHQRPEENLLPDDDPSDLPGYPLRRPLQGELAWRQPTAGTGADGERFYARAVSMEVLDRMLREGADPWIEPGPQRGGPARGAVPLPYRERLQTLLDDQPS